MHSRFHHQHPDVLALCTHQHRHTNLFAHHCINEFMFLKRHDLHQARRKGHSGASDVPHVSILLAMAMTEAADVALPR